MRKRGIIIRTKNLDSEAPPSVLSLVGQWRPSCHSSKAIR